MRISGEAQLAQRGRFGPLEQHVAVLGRRAGALPEDVGGGGGDPLEAGRRFAVPGGAAGDHVGEAVERAVREGVEVDRAVGVAGVERLFGAGGDVGVGELDQRHVGVGAHQLVGGVAVLTGVEDRFAAQDRHEGLQLGAVARRPDRRVAQNQQARVHGAADERHRQRPTRPHPGPRRTSRRVDAPDLRPRPVEAAGGGSRSASPAAPRSSAPWPGSTRRCRPARRGRAARRRRAPIGTAKSRRRSHQTRAEQDREPRRSRRQPGQLGAAGSVEPVVGGRPDAQRLDRRDRAVGVRPGDLVEAVDEAEGPDQGEHARGRRARRSISSVAGCAQGAQPRPRRQRPPHRGQGEAQRATIATGQASPAKL